MVRRRRREFIELNYSVDLVQRLWRQRLMQFTHSVIMTKSQVFVLLFSTPLKCTQKIIFSIEFFRVSQLPPQQPHVEAFNSASCLNGEFLSERAAIKVLNSLSLIIVLLSSNFAYCWRRRVKLYRRNIFHWLSVLEVVESFIEIGIKWPSSMPCSEQKNILIEQTTVESP